MTLNKIYRLMPNQIQDWAVSYQGWRLRKYRFGKDFNLALENFLERDDWPPEKINEYQQKKLSEALERASRTPFYQRLFTEMGANWRDFNNPKYFSMLPVVSKSDIKNKLDDFRPRLALKSDKMLKTSGTTGESFSFPVSNNIEPEQWALWWRYRMWHDIRRGDKCALFASAPIVHGKLDGRPWRYDKVNNEYRFSIFHISKETAATYVESLNMIKPRWIHGNPTAIALLSQYIIELKLKLNFKVNTITVGSENFLGWQQEIIQKTFGIKAFQHYGQAEAVANISECEHGNLHTDEDYSYVEYIDEKNDGSLSIVGTQFNNHAFCLIRYKTGDLARLSNDQCPCGRYGRIIKTLDGRLTDFIYLPNGEKIASLAAPFHDTENLAGAQIYQENNGNLLIKYIPSEGWDEKNLDEIEKKLRIRVGEQINISFLQVNEIEKTPRGKMKLVISDYSPSS